MDAQERIKQQVTGNPVVLYMKGTPQFPQCGFSANAVQILKACGVEQVFTVNVLEEPEIRQGIKEYANTLTVKTRSEEHTSELQSHSDLVCRLLLEKKNKNNMTRT